MRGVSIPADPILTREVTVANGQTISSDVDLRGHVVVGVVTPAALTSTSLTFQQKLDGETTWKTIHDREGTAYTVTVAADRFVAIPPGDVAAFRNTRLVMGSAEGGARTIKLVLRALN